MISIKHRIYRKYCNNLELTVFLFEEIKDWKELSERTEKFSQIIYSILKEFITLIFPIVGWLSDFIALQQGKKVKFFTLMLKFQISYLIYRLLLNNLSKTE